MSLKNVSKAVCLLFIAILYLPSGSHGKNILFFFGMSTYSHRITAWPLAVKLAEQGHSVTFLQAVENKSPHPNITDIIPHEVVHIVPPNFVELRVNHGKKVVYIMTWFLPQFGADMCSQYLNNSKNVEWVNSNKFDLIVIDALFNDCAYGLAWKWNAKTIVFGTTHVFDWFPDGFGFPDEGAYTPSIHYATDLPMGFFGRVKSCLSYLYFYFIREYRSLNKVTETLRDKLNMADMPAVTDLAKNTSLIFINTHYSEEFARSLPPFVIPIGGMHVSEEVKPLPKDMETFIEGAGDKGFIYVSFGSEADMAKSPGDIRSIFFSALGKSEARFLWRWSGDRPKEMPANVMTASWMPQQDILGHPKCRGFITHGGLLSMQEAVIHGVPMITFPIFAEQDYNSERLQRTGRGIRLEIGDLTQSDLETAIHRLLNDASLKEQMRLTSMRFKDRPEKPVDTALWWVNYLFRHEDLSFLRPRGASLYWFQRRQLDAWAFIVAILFLSLYSSWKITNKIFGLCCGGSSRKTVAVAQGKKRN